MPDKTTSEPRRRDGFDVAYLAIWAIGVFLTVFTIGLVGRAIAAGGDPIGDNGQVVFVSAIGAISTVAGAALGYQVGSRAPRRSTDPVDTTVPMVLDIEAHGVEHQHDRRQSDPQG